MKQQEIVYRRYYNEDEVKTMIAAAVAAERERCAKKCEDFSENDSLSTSNKRAMILCAFAIRTLK